MLTSVRDYVKIWQGMLFMLDLAEEGLDEVLQQLMDSKHFYSKYYWYLKVK